MNGYKKSSNRVSSGIDSLLKEISVLHKQAEVVRSKKESEGGYFNVFNTLGLKTEEVRLHSAFIAELLNPNGSHGLSDTFLKLFMEELNMPDNYINTKKVSSEKIKERYIGRVTKTEGGKIDIVVEDGNHALIIENKIYAEDQKNQLIRYYNYGKKSFPNGFKLLYLTLDGNEASEWSVGLTQLDYNPISYDKEVISWLDKCIEASSQKVLVNSAIRQYLELIKQITVRDMDAKYREKLIKKLMQPENAIIASEIMSLEHDWFNQILEEYVWNPLKDFATKKGMKFEKYIPSNDPGGAYIYKKEWKYYGLYIWTLNKRNWNSMMVGISFHGKPGRQKIIQKNYKKMDCLKEPPQKNWPYGLEYLPDDFYNWDKPITPQLVNGEVLNFITEKFEEMLSEIEGGGFIMP